MKLNFYKLHGLGNDFVLLDFTKKSIRLTSQLIKKLADRKTGLGFDQLLVLKPKKKLIFYNADGSRAEMCGNGLRAAVLYIYKKTKSKQVILFTDAGQRRSKILNNSGYITCEMGVPKLRKLPEKVEKRLFKSIPLQYKKYFKFLCTVDVGNPHLVVQVTSKKILNNLNLIGTLGAVYEVDSYFQKRTNVEFIYIENSKQIDVRVWERGVGFTQACGTGAVASASAAIDILKLQKSVEVQFPGGKAQVEWRNHKKSALLTGYAALVYCGWITDPLSKVG